MKTKLCSSCYRGDITEPATVAVKGLLNNRPYRANLCESHLAGLEIYEGLEVRSCHKIETKPSPLYLRKIYSHLCATVTLDKAGFAMIQAARNRWVCSVIDAGDIE
jgi:hypothetical protein